MYCLAVVHGLCTGFSLHWLLLFFCSVVRLPWALGHAGFRSCDLQALGPQLNSCRAQA